MNQNLHSGAVAARAKLWAGLTLSTIVAASGVVAIANAEGAQHQLRQNAGTRCASANPCFQRTNTSTGTAIQGSAVSGAGLTGNSSSGNGVSGTSTSGPGVAGTSSSTFGVYGYTSNFNAGVGGYNTYTGSDASGVYGESSNGPGVTGFTASSSSYGMISEGNMEVQGEIYTSGSCHNGCAKQRHQASFAARTSQPTIDDMGEAALHSGVARVALASDFTNAIDSNKPYLVLLTPEGDASLYVANRNATGFEVREVGGGRGSVAFAYRIVAKPYGVKDERLPFKTDAVTPHAPAAR